MNKIDEWMGMKEMLMWVNGVTNEWTGSQQKKYKVCVNIKWMSGWMFKNADGVNELTKRIEFTLVTIDMTTQYRRSYNCLHRTGYVEITMQIILCLKIAPSYIPSVTTDESIKSYTIIKPSEPGSFLTTQILIQSSKYSVIMTENI